MEPPYDLKLPLPENLTTEVAFLVMCNRSDKELPTVTKSTGVLHEVYEDAEKELEELTKTVGGPYYGIYRVAVIVESRVK